MVGSGPSRTGAAPSGLGCQARRPRATAASCVLSDGPPSALARWQPPRRPGKKPPAAARSAHAALSSFISRAALGRRGAARLGADNRAGRCQPPRLRRPGFTSAAAGPAAALFIARHVYTGSTRAAARRPGGAPTPATAAPAPLPAASARRPAPRRHRTGSHLSHYRLSRIQFADALSGAGGTWPARRAAPVSARSVARPVRRLGRAAGSGRPPSDSDLPTPPPPPPPAASRLLMKKQLRQPAPSGAPADRAAAERAAGRSGR